MDYFDYVAQKVERQNPPLEPKESEEMQVEEADASPSIIEKHFSFWR